MNESGFLVYKCRRCGELIKNTRVPNGVIALTCIEKTGHTPNGWDGVATRNSICSCKDGGIGVSDLIGFESDELIEKKRQQRLEFLNE